MYKLVNTGFDIGIFVRIHSALQIDACWGVMLKAGQNGHSANADPFAKPEESILLLLTLWTPLGDSVLPPPSADSKSETRKKSNPLTLFINTSLNTCLALDFFFCFQQQKYQSYSSHKTSYLDLLFLPLIKLFVFNCIFVIKTFNSLYPITIMAGRRVPMYCLCIKMCLYTIYLNRF